MQHPIQPPQATAITIADVGKAALTIVVFWLFFVIMWSLSSPQLGGM